MLARGILGRLAVGKTSARDLPQLARYLSTALVARNASTLPAVRALTRAYQSTLEAHRSFATTTSATTPTATVKKAVKAKAATKAAPKKKVAAKTARTPAKKAAKKPAASKAKPKTRAKKAAPKKPAPKKRVKKEVTPEAKAKARIAELRKIALKEPVASSRVSAYNAYVAEQLQGKGKDVGTVAGRITEVGARFRNLTPAELEHYNHLAHERSAAKLAEYQAWIHSHTPLEIHAANNARKQLRAMLKGSTKRGAHLHTAKLVDDRQAKRPSNAYAIFSTDRQASGDFKGIKVVDRAKLIGAEWNSLSAGEKKKFEDAAAEDAARYKRELAAYSDSA